MDSDAFEHLTPDEAKERLRAVAREMGLAPWVRRQPLDAVLTAAVSGFVLGTIPRLVRMFVGAKMIKRTGRSLVRRLL